MRKRFVNPYTHKIRRNALHFLLWQMGFYNERSPHVCPPSDFTYPNPDGQINPSAPTVTWVNHSTFWVRTSQTSILFDPIWNKRCSPFPFIGPKRRLNPKPSFEEMERVDYVVISHNHYDHLDRKTIFNLRRYYPSIQWILPKGVMKWFARTFGIEKEKITELGWWESYTCSHLIFTAVPAQHFSGRGVFDRNKTLWMGCVIEFSNEQKRLYFAGDTGYNAFDFKAIGNKFGGMDLSLLPIGVYAPRKFMKPVHVNPDESILIHQEVRSKLSIGGHWGTFRLSSEDLERPPYDLYCALQKAQLTADEFRVLKPGQTINW